MWQATVILLPGVGEPGSFLNGVTSIPLDPLNPLDPVDPVMSSERAPMYCKKQYSGRFFRENDSQNGPWTIDHGSGVQKNDFSMIRGPKKHFFSDPGSKKHFFNDPGSKKTLFQ